MEEISSDFSLKLISLALPDKSNFQEGLFQIKEEIETITSTDGWCQPFY